MSSAAINSNGSIGVTDNTADSTNLDPRLVAQLKAWGVPPQELSSIAQQWEAALNDPTIDAIIQKQESAYDANANEQIGKLETLMNSMSDGDPRKAALQGAINSLDKQKQIVDKIFKDVVIYSAVGLWAMANAEMNNVAATQDCQYGSMSLEEAIETAAANWSSSWTTQMNDEETAIQKYIAPGGHGGDDEQEQSMKVNAMTSQFNMYNTDMQTFGTFCSSMNNVVSNGVTQEGQNVSVDTSNITQSVQKLFDAMAQFLQ